MITRGILYLVIITLEVLVIMTVLYEVTDKWHR